MIADHKVLVATLDEDVRAAGHAPWESTRAPSRHAVPSLETPAAAPRLAGAFIARQEAARRRRARILEEIEATAIETPMRDPPIVTRHGVLRVEADFSQLSGVDAAVDARLFGAGIRTAEAFFQEPLGELARVTGLPEETLRAARADLDLAHIGDMGTDAADLLRVVGVHTVSDLARRAPADLAARIAAESRRHQGLRIPSALRDTLAIERLVSLAKTRQA